VKYPACAGYEIITFGHCEIFCPAESEMKFAHIGEANISHLQKQIFHSEVISLARRANFVAPNKKRQAKPVFFYLVRMMGLSSRQIPLIGVLSSIKRRSRSIAAPLPQKIFRIFWGPLLLGGFNSTSS